MKLVLASKSPRRHDILNWMGIPFESDVCTDPEVVPENLSASDTVRTLAYHKASFVRNLHPDDFVLGADTIVVLDGEVLGKPSSPAQARSYLSSLSCRTHTVYTGVALLHGPYADIRADATKVTFRKLSPEEIEWYVATGEPLDKAGAYGIQGLASVFVERIEGNYFNVIGLPAPTVYDMLIKAGFLTVSRQNLL